MLIQRRIRLPCPTSHRLFCCFCRVHDRICYPTGHWAGPCRHGPGPPCFGPRRAVPARPGHPVVPCRAGPPRLRSGPGTAQSPSCRGRAVPAQAQPEVTIDGGGDGGGDRHLYSSRQCRDRSCAWGGESWRGREARGEGESQRGREESSAWGGEELRVEGWRRCVGLGIGISRDGG